MASWSRTNVAIRRDHRVTDAALIAKVSDPTRNRCRTPKSRPICAVKGSARNRSRFDPIGPMPVWPPKIGVFRLTGQRFLPRNRLLAGRFRPALRFATRGPSFQA